MYSLLIVIFHLCHTRSSHSEHSCEDDTERSLSNLPLCQSLSFSSLHLFHVLQLIEIDDTLLGGSQLDDREVDGIV